jgi:membrane peptidoglycan carboxypeptidase
LSIFTATGRNIYSKLFTSNNRIYGGSTITQQLAKSFLTHERTLDRKFKELKISRILEKNFSKNVILEMYLNRVYLGQNTWGLAAASLKYFQHKYTKLSLEESAMIIPFLAAPTKYNLIDNPQEAKSRQMNFLKRLTSN